MSTESYYNYLNQKFKRIQLMTLLVCRSCGIKFDPVKKKLIIRAGYVNQCASCSARTGDVNQKYLGRPGASNKSADITIFRTDLAAVRGTLRRESAIGRNANIDLSSAVNASAKKDDLGLLDLTATRAICHPPTTCQECNRKLDCLGTPWKK
jgi:hypothetical protein